MKDSNKNKTQQQPVDQATAFLLFARTMKAEMRGSRAAKFGQKRPVKQGR